MSVIVKSGGGKPEEEKTVTAGTSVIEVSPSSGKVMKKVTVNPTPTESKEVTAGTSDTTVSPTEGKHLSGVTVHPTPSQEKTVIPTADGFKVSPDIGKLLSAVFVDGDSDLVAGNIKQGVNIFGVDGSFDNSHGAYVWKKLTAEGGDFIDFAVDNSPTAYPDGGLQGGYWYEKFQLDPALFGYTKISVDKFTFANDIGSQEFVTHNLGDVPKMAIIIGKSVSGGLRYMFTRPEIEQQSQLNGYIFTLHGSNYSLATSSIKFNVDANRLRSVDYAYGYQGGMEYTLITMA